MNGELADAIFNGTRFLSVLIKRDGKKVVDGGERLVMPLSYAKNTTVKAMDEYDTLDLTQVDTITAAEFLWKMTAGVALLTKFEENKNYGEYAIIDLVTAKIENLVHSLQDELNRQLFNDGSITKEIVGMEAVISTTGTYGGIARASNTFWQAQVTAVGGALTTAAMSAIFNTTSANRWYPDLITTTKLQYERYEALCQAVQRINMPAIGDISFDTLNYRGTAVIWDHYVPTGVMYFNTLKFLKLFTHSQGDFQLEEPMRHPFQFITIYPCLFFGALGCNNPRLQGKLTGLT